MNSLVPDAAKSLRTPASFAGGPPIGARLSSRDNNLNILRALAAVAVLVSHAWPIALGTGAVEPLEEMAGMSLGGMAVIVFFAISGYLVTASFARRSNAADFLLARGARLLPGLLVSLLVVAFFMGTLTTTLTVGDYLVHPETWTFLLRNLTLLKVQFDLPGVFETNPYPKVEGSIWTLVYEVACYLGVLCCGIIGLLSRRVAATVVLLGYLFAAAVLTSAGIKTIYQLDMLLGLSQPFVLGMLAYLWRDHVPASPWIAAALCVTAALTVQGPFGPFALVCALAYGALAFAVWPSTFLGLYRKLGDYSYGIYIYAFPIQGLAVWLLGPMTPMENILWSLPLTLALSILSWNLVEKPALGWTRSRTVESPVRSQTGT